jgi:hypothetical protein
MLFSRRYILPTPLVQGVGNVSRSVATAATFWVALVKVGSYRSTHSVVVVQPASSINSCWRRSVSLASTAASCLVKGVGVAVRYCLIGRV